MVDNRDDHWSNRPSVYWAGFGVVFVFFSSFKIDWGWLTPAWVQAIGTLLALAIAIYVPHRIHVREAKERADDQRRQGQGIALLIRGTFGPLDIELSNAVRHVWTDKFAAISINVPTLIREQVSRLWLMGRAGEQILRLVSKIDAYKRFMEVNRRLFDEAHPSLEAVSQQDLVKYLNMEEEIPESLPEITRNFLKEFVIIRKTEEMYLKSAREDINDILEAIDRPLENKP